MRKQALQKISALALFGILGIASIPSCVLRIETGTGDQSSTEGNATIPADTSGGQAGGDSVFTPEEEAAFAELANANPEGAAKTLAASEYAAYALAGYLESNVSDSSALDEDTLNQLMDQYSPLAWEQAQQWAETLDPNLLTPLAAVKPKYSCVSEYGCEYMDLCEFDDGSSAACTIVGCGKGPCPYCPDVFGDLSSLVVKNWCLFTCMKGPSIVGVKLVLHFQLFGKRGRCLRLEKPIP